MSSSPLSVKKHYVAYCGGHACPVCFKCSDWYYNRYEHTDCDDDMRPYIGHLGPLVGPLYSWHRRADATCGYRSYPHYIYYKAYHGACCYALCPPRSSSNLDSSHHHRYPKAANHGPNICHCNSKE
jgi:hypothetical protein